MTYEKPELKWWYIGLAAFAVVIALGMAITQGDVTYGIIDHQQAGTAAKVNEIQAQWRNGGVRTLAIIAMLGDLVFIGIYGWGSYVAGKSIAACSHGIARWIGLIVGIAAVVFLLTDYTETILQVIQLLREQGSDWMAGTAATARPVKVAAWIVTFIGVILALVVRRFSAARA